MFKMTVITLQITNCKSSWIETIACVHVFVSHKYTFTRFQIDLYVISIISYFVYFSSTKSVSVCLTSPSCTLNYTARHHILTFRWGWCFTCKNVEIPEPKFVMNRFICIVCVYFRSMTSIWVVVQIVVDGDGHCWNLLCMLRWYGFIAQTHSIVM